MPELPELRDSDDDATRHVPTALYDVLEGGKVVERVWLSEADAERLGARVRPATPDPDEAVAPADLKGKALDAALDEAGLSKAGTANAKRARLIEHLA